MADFEPTTDNLYWIHPYGDSWMLGVALHSTPYSHEGERVWSFRPVSRKHIQYVPISRVEPVLDASDPRFASPAEPHNERSLDDGEVPTRWSWYRLRDGTLVQHTGGYIHRVRWYGDPQVTFWEFFPDGGGPFVSVPLSEVVAEITTAPAVNDESTTPVVVLYTHGLAPGLFDGCMVGVRRDDGSYIAAKHVSVDRGILDCGNGEVSIFDVKFRGKIVDPPRGLAPGDPITVAKITHTLED